MLIKQIMRMTLLAVLMSCTALYGAVITFDTAVSGATSFEFDGDGDGTADVIFTTTDPAGFNTIGPGLNQNYIHEPGLEGTSTLAPDLRVDFLNGASGSIQFGFAVNSVVGGDSASFLVYDSSGSVIGTGNASAAKTPTGSGMSSFPEGVVTVNFSGVASYATFDFTSQLGRYIIDDFTGTFGSTEVIVPEPASASLLLIGAAGFLMLRKRSRA